MEQTKTNFSTRDLCMIALFTALICVLSQISIPTPSGIPFTLQTFIVPLAGVILGARRGAIAAGLYVLMGAIGLPVFAGGMSGLSVVAGVTGGFLLGFPVMALCAGLGASKNNVLLLVLGLIVGIIADYAIGCMQFMFVTQGTLVTALTVAVLPYIPLQCVKAALVVAIGYPCKQRLVKAGVVLS